MPTFRFERAVWKTRPEAVIAGVDEAGRGPLAGPVVAGAVIIDQTRLPRKLARGLDDSKKLDAATREELFAALQNCGGVVWAVGEASVAEIDRVNILQATYLAMGRAVEKLGRRVDVALVDGNQPPPLGCDVQTIIEGDSLSVSIAAASIFAKVTRDRIMRELALSHPGYAWETNMGYGTREHRDGLVRLGPTPHHRRTFAPVREIQMELELRPAPAG